MPKTVVHPLFCYRFQRNECPYVKPDSLNFFGPGGAKPGLPTHCFSPQWPYCGEEYVFQDDLALANLDRPRAAVR